MITIKLFAMLKDRAGTDELHVPFERGTVADLLRAVSAQEPRLVDLLSCGKILVAVNKEFAKPDAPVQSGDEVALMPPFSGGSTTNERVRIQREPFSIEREIESLKRTSASIGAIVSFVGTTRDLSRDKKVSKLEFEHYPGMAEKQLAELRKRAIREFGIIEATIIHRTGMIPVGDDIVLIVVASMHREDAFAACRFCIDELKRSAPIWKKETTAEGEVWVEEHP
jgi:molybdopterin converting factor subunit 1